MFLVKRVGVFHVFAGPYTGGVRGGSNEPPSLPVNMLIASESERT